MLYDFVFVRLCSYVCVCVCTCVHECVCMHFRCDEFGPSIGAFLPGVFLIESIFCRVE